MFIRTVVLFFGIAASHLLWAFTCYYTLAKDNCWTNYNVTVDVVDAVTTNILTTVTVPAGSVWTRQEFICNPGQKLIYRAHFSPIFWENDKDKIYTAKHYWTMPKEIQAGETAWNISVCYPSQFGEVPLPPNVSGNCQCDFSTIPDLVPK